MICQYTFNKKPTFCLKRFVLRLNASRFVNSSTHLGPSWLHNSGETISPTTCSRRKSHSGRGSIKCLQPTICHSDCVVKSPLAVGRRLHGTSTVHKLRHNEGARQSSARKAFFIQRAHTMKYLNDESRAREAFSERSSVHHGYLPEVVLPKRGSWMVR